MEYLKGLDPLNRNLSEIILGFMADRIVEGDVIFEVILEYVVKTYSKDPDKILLFQNADKILKIAKQMRDRVNKLMESKIIKRQENKS